MAEQARPVESESIPGREGTGTHPPMAVLALSSAPASDKPDLKVTFAVF